MSDGSRQILLKGTTVGVVLGLSWLFAGLLGLAVGAAALLVAWVASPRWVAGAALAALAVAAAGTVVVPFPSDPGVKVTYADDRPVASEAGRIVGVLTLVAIVGFADRERTRVRPEPRDDGDRAGSGRSGG